MVGFKLKLGEGEGDGTKHVGFQFKATGGLSGDKYGRQAAIGARIDLGYA